MRTRLLSFGVWALVAAASMFWGLKLGVTGPGLPSQAQTPARGLALGGDRRRLLGESAAAAADDDEAPAGSERLRLLGVVAPRGAETSPQGVAVIAVGDQPARAWRTGSVVDGDLVLLSVARRSVQLGPRGGPATTELTLPEPGRSTGPVAPPVVRPPVLGVPPIAPGTPAGAAPRPMGVPVPGGLVTAKPAAPAASEDEDE